MPTIRCFWLEVTDQVRRGLRRYRSIDEPGAECPGALQYHNAENPFDVVAAVFDERDSRRLSSRLASIDDEVETEDWRWPKHCDVCGYGFTDEDPRQVSVELLYRRSDTDERLVLTEAPPGAMWDAWWLNNWWRGPDGLCLVVRTPAGDWLIDGECCRCSDAPRNDRRKQRREPGVERTRRCWMRNGDPRTGLVSVEISGSPTCSAGDGSIVMGSYRAYLRNGCLVDA